MISLFRRPVAGNNLEFIGRLTETIPATSVSAEIIPASLIALLLIMLLILNLVIINTDRPKVLVCL